MTEQLDGAVPGIAPASYAASDRLLAELRDRWPPDGAAELLPPDSPPPAVALDLGPRYAVGLVPDAAIDDVYLTIRLVRDPAARGGWRTAAAGDGMSAFVAGVPLASEAAIDADQTNASVVVGARAIVKWFRRVGPGPSRAALLLAHLDEVGFRELPAPLGSVTWRSPAGSELTIAQGDAFLPAATDGWDWCVRRLSTHIAHDVGRCPAGCEPWIGGRLGGLIGRLHAALRTPSASIPEPSSRADSSLVAAWRSTAEAALDDAIALTTAADRQDGDQLLELAPAMRAEIARLPTDRAVEIQPVHGDLHVGQILEWSGGHAVIDFDGNPALGAEANAVRQPVERDIAQMLTSLDHVGRIVDRRTSEAATDRIEAWIGRNRSELLAALDPPPAADLLAAFEVEQECRELVYAARFLPRWRYAPIATLRARSTASGRAT